MSPRERLAVEALTIFAELTDPAGAWCTSADSTDSTVYHLILDKIWFGDRDRAGRFLALLFEHATDQELRDVVRVLKEDRASMREMHSEDHAAAMEQWRHAEPAPQAPNRRGP